MEQQVGFDTLLVCGVPVLRWRGAASERVLRESPALLRALARHGYREVVLDLQQVVASAPQEWRHLLWALEKTLPPALHAEVVLPAERLVDRSLRRMRVAPSLALALSHLTRLPLASLQPVRSLRISWQQFRDEE